MKKLVLGLGLFSMLTTSVQAFESGTYECAYPYGTMTFVLQDNGRAKQIFAGITTRGEWLDKGNEALVIKEDIIIEKIGDKYVMPGNGLIPDYPCLKAQEGQESTSIENASMKNNAMAKSVKAHENRTQEQKARDLAKHKAKKFANDYKTSQATGAFLPPQAQMAILNSTVIHPFNQLSPEGKKLVIEELNNLGVKIPSVNE